MAVKVTHNGYEFAVRHDGNSFVATCQRTGRVKIRRNYRVWTNKIVTPEGPVQELCRDWELVDVLEAGVSELQSQMSPRQFEVMRSIQMEHVRLKRRRGQRSRESKDRYEAKD